MELSGFLALHGFQGFGQLFLILLQVFNKLFCLFLLLRRPHHAYITAYIMYACKTCWNMEGGVVFFASSLSGDTRSRIQFHFYKIVLHTDLCVSGLYRRPKVCVALHIQPEKSGITGGNNLNWLISPAATAKNTTNSGRNDAVALYISWPSTLRFGDLKVADTEWVKVQSSCRKRQPSTGGKSVIDFEEMKSLQIYLQLIALSPADCSFFSTMSAFK